MEMMEKQWYIETPLGGYNEDTKVYASMLYDDNLKFAEVDYHPDLDFISLFLFWNKFYSEIPVDEKYPYKSKHIQTKLSKEEAISLRDALTRQIERMELNEK